MADNPDKTSYPINVNTVTPPYNCGQYSLQELLQMNEDGDLSTPELLGIIEYCKLGISSTD